MAARSRRTTPARPVKPRTKAVVGNGNKTVCLPRAPTLLHRRRVRSRPPRATKVRFGRRPPRPLAWPKPRRGIPRHPCDAPSERINTPKESSLRIWRLSSNVHRAEPPRLETARVQDYPITARHIPWDQSSTPVCRRGHNPEASYRPGASLHQEFLGYSAPDTNV